MTEHEMIEHAKTIMADQSVPLHKRQEDVRKAWLDYHAPIRVVDVGVGPRLESPTKLKMGRPVAKAKLPKEDRPINLCRVCEKEIPPSGKRGRPATMHKACKESLVSA